MSSSDRGIASMINRFRADAPTSRAERLRQMQKGELKELWFISDEDAAAAGTSGGGIISDGEASTPDSLDASHSMGRALHAATGYGTGLGSTVEEMIEEDINRLLRKSSTTGHAVPTGMRPATSTISPPRRARSHMAAGQLHESISPVAGSPPPKHSHSSYHSSPSRKQRGMPKGRLVPKLEGLLAVGGGGSGSGRGGEMSESSVSDDEYQQGAFRQRLGLDPLAYTGTSELRSSIRGGRTVNVEERRKKKEEEAHVTEVTGTGTGMSSKDVASELDLVLQKLKDGMGKGIEVIPLLPYTHDKAGSDKPLPTTVKQVAADLEAEMKGFHSLQEKRDALAKAKAEAENTWKVEERKKIEGELKAEVARSLFRAVGELPMDEGELPQELWHLTDGLLGAAERRGVEGKDEEEDSMALVAKQLSSIKRAVEQRVEEIQRREKGEEEVVHGHGGAAKLVVETDAQAPAQGEGIKSHLEVVEQVMERHSQMFVTEQDHPLRHSAPEGLGGHCHAGRSGTGGLYGPGTLQMTGESISAELDAAMLCMQKRLGRDAVVDPVAEEQRSLKRKEEAEAASQKEKDKAAKQKEEELLQHLDEAAEGMYRFGAGAGAVASNYVPEHASWQVDQELRNDDWLFSPSLNEIHPNDGLGLPPVGPYPYSMYPHGMFTQAMYPLPIPYTEPSATSLPLNPPPSAPPVRPATRYTAASLAAGASQAHYVEPTARARAYFHAEARASKASYQPSPNENLYADPVPHPTTGNEEQEGHASGFEGQSLVTARESMRLQSQTLKDGEELRDPRQVLQQFRLLREQIAA